MSDVEFASDQEYQTFLTDIKERVNKGITEVALGGTKIRYVNQKTITNTTLVRAILRWSWHSQKDKKINFDDWRHHVLHKLGYNIRLFLLAIINDFEFGFFDDLVQLEGKSDLDLPFDPKEFTTCQSFSSDAAKDRFLESQYLVCAPEIKHGEFDLEISSSCIPITKATRKDEFAMVAGLPAWMVKIHDDFMNFDQGEYVLTEFSGEATDEQKALAKAGFASGGKYYLLS